MPSTTEDTKERRCCVVLVCDLWLLLPVDTYFTCRPILVLEAENPNGYYITSSKTTRKAAYIGSIALAAKMIGTLSPNLKNNASTSPWSSYSLSNPSTRQRQTLICCKRTFTYPTFGRAQPQNSRRSYQVQKTPEGGWSCGKQFRVEDPVPGWRLRLHSRWSSWRCDNRL
jgi:hypothetical protein